MNKYAKSMPKRPREEEENELAECPNPEKLVQKRTKQDSPPYHQIRLILTLLTIGTYIIGTKGQAKKKPCELLRPATLRIMKFNILI